MQFRRYRTVQVAELDRVMAEAEATRRAIAAGSPWATVHRAERILDGSGTPVWEIVVRVARRRVRKVRDRS